MAYDPNNVGLMVDDLSTGRRPLGSRGSVAELATDSNNSTTLVGPDGLGVPITSRIQSAIEAAFSNNAIELDPWLLPPEWTLGATYYRGQLVRNSAGDAYMMWHNQSSIGVGIVETGAEPTHKTQVPTVGAGGTILWLYRGKARGLAAGSYESATPAAATDTMAGYIAICTTAEAQALGLTTYIGYGFTYTTFPARLIGLRDESLADSVFPVMLGANTGSVGSPNYSTDAISFGVHFKTNSRWLFLVQGSPVYAGVDRLAIEINGRRLSDSPMTRPNSVQKEGRLIDMSKFPGAVKDVKIFGRDTLNNDLVYAIHLDATSYVLPGESLNSLRISFEGDSLTSGGSGLPTFEGDKWPLNVARMIGASNWYMNAVGGTGFINNNSGAATTYLERISRINLFAPDIHVIMGGYNDASSTSAQRRAAVLLYLQTFRAANPDAYIFLFGNLLLQGSNVATYQATEADLEAAVATFNDSRCVFVPILTDPRGSWYAGGSVNGYNFYTTGSAPFVDTHHTIGAYKMLESQVTAAIRSYFAG